MKTNSTHVKFYSNLGLLLAYLYGICPLAWATDLSGLGEGFDSTRQTRANSTCHHLTNISTRASIQGGQGDTIAGFIISGTGTQQVLLRGWGLDTGVNPKVTVQKFPSGDLIVSNDDWQVQTPPSLAISSELGLPNPTDAGVLLDLPAGAYTLTLSSVGNLGLGLVGVDAIETAGTQTAIKLINISTRAPILGGTGDVIAGFMISGTGTQSVIVRGWGLDAGVDTKLTVQKFPSGEVIVTNDNWQTQAASATAIPTAYQMPKGTDAAVWLNLPAGAYTATLESVGMKGLGLIGVDAVGDDGDCSSVTPPPTTTYYPLTTSVQGSGKITSVPAGIDCGTDCTENYAVTTMVTLTAAANANVTFKGWSGACVGTGISTSVTLDTAKNCTATFEVATTTVGSCNTTNTSCPILNTLMPPSEGMVAWLGSGLDGDRNQLKQMTCLNGTSRSITGGSAKLSTSLVFDYEDVLEQQITKGGGSLSIGFFNAHANTKYEKIFHQTSYSQSFLFDYVVNLGDTLYDANTSNPLTYTTNDSCEFRKICGDQYVCQVGQGGKVSVQMDFEFNNQFQKRDFSLSAGAGIKDWKKTICGACGSKVISISGNLEAEVSKLSQTTKSSGQLRITASQEGGRPEQLVQVIGANTTTCSLTNITACKKVLDDVVNYVSGEGFAGSLRELPPATLDYKYCPYGQIPGVPLLNTDVTSEIAAARQELATKYRERLAALEKVRDLLQFSMLPTRYQELQNLETNLSGEVEKIGQAGQSCFKDLSNCLKNKCESLGNLTSYDPNILEFQLEDGLVAYYPFNGNAKDENPNNIPKSDGNVPSSVTLDRDRFGVSGKAYNFAKGYIEVPNTQNVKFQNQSLTFSAWAYLSGNDDYYRAIISLGSSAYKLIRLGKNRTKTYLGKVTMIVYDSAQSSATSKNTYSTYVNSWHHFVGVVDSSQTQIRLYIDGALDVVSEELSNFDTSEAKLRIGQHPYSHELAAVWGGLIDDVRIWQRALSDAEVRQLYEMEKPK